MKMVLIIDETALFREFLKDKLTAQKINVEIAMGGRDGFAKLLATLPDLLIIDTKLTNQSVMDFLQKKRDNPNAAQIPVFLTGPTIPKDKIAQLALYNVHKYFTKPIKIDVFFESIGKMLKISFPIDTTPCILETHVNDNIIFIEIAQGLNREKLGLLKYRISELIDQNQLTHPKIVIMMTDLALTFIDGANLELLFENIIADTRVKQKNIKVLTFDPFTLNFLKGHTEYEDIEGADNLASVLTGLIKTETGDMSDLITEKFLTSTSDGKEGSVHMRFNSEMGVRDNELEELVESPRCVAIVDDDIVVRTILNKSFNAIGAVTEVFDSGSAFLAATNQKVYDMIILDLFMPGISGFDILQTLKTRKYVTPVLVYSSASQREAVVQALALGAKSYLVKPLQPELVVRKAVEILNSKL